MAETAERKWISDIQNGDSVDQVFLVASKELRMSRKGTQYISGEVMDRTGSLPMRMFDATEKIFESFAVEDFVQVLGKVDSYQDNLQLIAKKVSKVKEDSVSKADFVPATDQDVDEMEQKLRQILRTVEDKHLIALLGAFFKDKDLVQKFKECPAAVQMHHAYLGGLLEHTLSLAKLAVRIEPEYPNLRKDLLLTGVFLHDLGKLQEFSWARGFQYTTEGNLVGHLILGVAMLEEKARTIDGFPQDVLDMLKHLILSHHGEYEFGSPKLPMTPEAIVLHYIDNLDAKLHAFRKAIDEDRDPASDWTEYNRMFGRRLYKK